MRKEGGLEWGKRNGSKRGSGDMDTRVMEVEEQGYLVLSKNI